MDAQGQPKFNKNEETRVAQGQVCHTCFNAFLRVVAHQPGQSRRSGASKKGSADADGAFVHRHYARHLRYTCSHTGDDRAELRLQSVLWG